MKLNYYTYKNETFTCPKCNFNGLGSQMFLGDLSEFHALRDLECPNCEATIGTFDLSDEKDNKYPKSDNQKSK